MKLAIVAPVLGMALVLGLGGCKKKEEATHAAAGGELLPRSVGDEMIPYDTARSQAPLKLPEGELPTGAAAHPKAQETAATGENEEVVTPAEASAEPAAAQ